MIAEIKFCGLTRPEDVAVAAELEASYVGVIFAGGPRSLTLGRAKDVLAAAPRTVRRVGVFADQTPDEIARMADELELTVVQLHGSASLERVAAVRLGFPGQIWPVCRVSGVPLPAGAGELMSVGDGLLLDAYVSGALGGSGASLPWDEISDEVAVLRSPEKLLILAGGLRPENVGRAIATLAPDVVDVSSGVESAPGIKDHDRMRAFRAAVAESVPT